LELVRESKMARENIRIAEETAEMAAKNMEVETVSCSLPFPLQRGLVGRFVGAETWLFQAQLLD
jgi:hypothetical protein